MMTTGGQPSGPVRVRFAPSPTGTLHVGSARTALYNFLFARHEGGVLVLRVEDTDAARSSRDFEESIMADLAWLCLSWDEGPDIGGGCGPYRQSERSAAGVYRDAAMRLLEAGKAYYCFCPQERLDELRQRCLDRGEMPRYDRACAGLAREEAAARVAAGEPATIRFRIPDRDVVVEDIIHGKVRFAGDVLGDFIILRSDGVASYNFAVVVDDIAMDITHVIRGEDHLTNTARQALLYDALGAAPPAFAHHSLIMGPDGGKLSKRHGATSVGDFRKMGYLAPAIVNYLALLSWSPGEDREKLTLTEMGEEFDLARVSRSPAIFDIQKLNWLNGLYIRELGPDDFHGAIGPFLGEVPAQLSLTAGQLAVAEAAVRNAMVVLTDAAGLIEDFFVMAPLGAEEDSAEIREPEAVAVLDLALAAVGGLKAADEFSAADAETVIAEAKEWLSALRQQCKERDIPPKRLFRTLRIALTGRTSGPEVPYLLAGLARETVSERLRAAREFAT
ncbi:MAG: glutamate--tRNA ligase [Gaiellales bacterium]|nr:MAG: glutamate--tRNA ligase [Gaiellales bacterium]